MVKLEDFCREALNLVKRNPTEWERLFASSMSHRRLTSKIYKETKKSKKKNKSQINPNNLFGAWELSKGFSEEGGND